MWVNFCECYQQVCACVFFFFLFLSLWKSCCCFDTARNYCSTLKRTSFKCSNVVMVLWRAEDEGFWVRFSLAQKKKSFCSENRNKRKHFTVQGQHKCFSLSDHKSYDCNQNTLDSKKNLGAFIFSGMFFFISMKIHYKNDHRTDLSCFKTMSFYILLKNIYILLYFLEGFFIV